MSNTIECPADYDCVKLHKESGSVCCPTPQETSVEENFDRQQSMCEYLRDFNERMEGTEEGMTLAITSPMCDVDGMYKAMQCQKKMVKVKKVDEKRVLENKSIREMKKLLDESKAKSRSTREAEAHLKEEVRSAKIIDGLEISSQSLAPKTRKRRPADVVDIEIEECWCVDGFGTEIPKTRSDNTSLEYCVE